MYWGYPSRDVAYRYPNQFYFGPNLIVNPVVTRRDPRTNLSKTETWVPPGRHVDILTEFVYDGDRELNLFRSLRHVPILAPEGAIIPFDGKLVPANGCANPDALEVLVVVGKDGDFTIIEDVRDDSEPKAAKGERQRSIQIKYNEEAGRLETVAGGKSWTFRFISLLHTPAPIRVFVDGNLSKEVRLHLEKLPELPGITVQLSNIPEASSTIRIELGENPQLSTLDPMPLLGDLIEQFQISNHLKDRIWDIVDSAQAAIVKVSGLLSLELDDLILGPLIELITSDSEKKPNHGVAENMV
jgi:hypothetical protein